ncbi:MAG: NTP transferase domain-containing protein [Candidatus Omnitrophica bacterium]|nr:NTP transferase domain-containing protein [Candidatus Omnitrophota bacterium]
MKSGKLRKPAGGIAAVILAAGRGERMGSSGPKVLESLSGRPMLDWVLESVAGLKISSVFVVVGYQGERIAEYLKGRKGIRCVPQKQQLGTADAVDSVLRYLKGYRTLLVLCGDTPLFRTESLKGLIQEHRRQGNRATFLSAEIPEPASYGRVVRQGRAVVRITEAKDCTPQQLAIREINTGAYVFERKALVEGLRVLSPSSSGEFYLTDLIGLWAEQSVPVNAVKLTDADEGWGVNSFEELVRATEILKNRILDYHRRRGVSIVDPATTCIASGVQIGKGSLVYPFTVIESGVRIGEECRIGPFSHLRSGTKVDSRAEIGNFVEVNRSRIGSSTKVKHLSYLGDASIGEKVNIGAGTITANFNGREKHRTVIDDGAMIGSNTTLVAPVRVGKRAVTGAGAVVLKERHVPVEGVAVGVPARILKRKNGIPSGF